MKLLALLFFVSGCAYAFPARHRISQRDLQDWCAVHAALLGNGLETFQHADSVAHRGRITLTRTDTQLHCRSVA